MSWLRLYPDGSLRTNLGTVSFNSNLPEAGTINGGYYTKTPMNDGTGRSVLVQSFSISANNGTQISLPISFSNTTYTVNIAPTKAAVSSGTPSHTVGYVAGTKTSSGFILTLQWLHSNGAGDETTRIPVDITVIGEIS